MTFTHTSEGETPMHRNKFLVVFLALLIASVIALSGCAKVEEGTAPVASDKASNAGGKIAVTTSSEDARKEFLLGRDLQEKLQVQDSIQHYDKAISLDPNFALAELNRAQVSPTGKEFFEHLKKAVALADKASNGEKILILANEAGANGNVAKQKELLDQLMAAFPNDERAHFNVGGYYFRPAGFSQSHRALQESNRDRADLLDRFQYPWLCLPAERGQRPTPSRPSRNTSS
jgi:tetratricopeptide (TPR) repeat protein